MAVGCSLASSSFYLFRAGWSVDVVLAGALTGRGATAWSRGSLGDTWAAFEILTYFGYLLPVLAVLQYRASKSRVSPQLVATACMAALSLALIATDGSRRGIGMVL